MKKFLMAGVSLLAILSANNAIAAGYTCEELIEYTSCMQGYYLVPGTPECPDGYSYITGACHIEEDPWGGYASAEECAEEYCNWYGGCEDISEAYGNYLGDGCLKSGFDEEDGEWVGYDFIPASVVGSSSTDCIECPAGSSCAGGTADKQLCAVGTYQPNTKQSSCIDAPAGNYVAKTGATSYTACVAGWYQPSSGQSSCTLCPAGSYCNGTGLFAVSGTCQQGTYSYDGATACSSCPERIFENSDGEYISAPATTAGAGSDSISACVIDSDQYFSDSRGKYHFTQSCSYDTTPLTYEEACVLNCARNKERCEDYGSDNCGCSDDSASEVLVIDSDTGEFFCWGGPAGGYADSMSYDEYKALCKSRGFRWEHAYRSCYDLDGNEFVPENLM